MIRLGRKAKLYYNATELTDEPSAPGLITASAEASEVTDVAVQIEMISAPLVTRGLRSGAGNVDRYFHEIQLPPRSTCQITAPLNVDDAFIKLCIQTMNSRNGIFLAMLNTARDESGLVEGLIGNFWITLGYGQRMRGIQAATIQASPKSVIHWFFGVNP